MFDTEISALTLPDGLRQALSEALVGTDGDWIGALAERLWDLEGHARGEILHALAPFDQIALLQRWCASSGALDLRGMALRRLPQGVFDLSVAPRLSRLVLADNALDELPPALADLTELTELDLSGNPLGELPPLLGQLTGLRSLKASHLGLTTLPDGLRHLSWLTRLDVSHNALEALPDIFGGLERLTLLRLDHNPLTDLPASLSQCASLQKIAVGGAAFAQLPEVLFQLPALELLHGIPGYATRAAQEALARALVLAGGRPPRERRTLAVALLQDPPPLAELPDEALEAQLTALCQSEALPPIEQLLLGGDDGAVALGLARLTPEEVPHALTGLFVVAKYHQDADTRQRARQLIDDHGPAPARAAVADRARIPSLAQKGEKKTTAHLEAFADRYPGIDWAEVGLYLYRTRKTGLRYVMESAPAHSPVKIAALRALVTDGRLDYYAGYATYMPDYANSFSRYPCGHFPVEVTQMRDVTALDLRGCRLCKIPSDIRQMTWLVELDLTGNQLQDLPDALADLPNLRRLRLDDNAFSELPPVLWQLSGLAELTLTGNRQGSASSPLVIPEDLTVALPACWIET